MPDYPPKMIFANGVDYILTIVDSNPYVGDYGEQMIYNFTHEGVKKSYFASGKAMGELSQYKNGDTIKMGKKQSGENWVFHIELHEGGSEPVADAPPPTAQGAPNWDAINSVKTWEIQKAVALKIAAGMSVAEDHSDVEAFFHGTFSILRNDGSLIVSRINRCKSLVELEALWKDEAWLWGEIIGLDKIGVIQKIKEKKASTLPQPKVEEPPPPPEPTKEEFEALPF